MTTAELDELIEEYILSGGRRTTAAALRTVLMAISTDKDAIASLQATDLITWGSDVGPEQGKSLYLNGFDPTVAVSHSFLKIKNTEQGSTPRFFWVDDEGFLRSKVGVPNAVTDGFIIQYGGIVQRQAETNMDIDYSKTQEIVVGGDTTTNLLSIAIEGAVSGSTFQGGHEITFYLTTALTFAHNEAPSGNLKPYILSGGTDFVGASGDVITFILNRATTQWIEKSRSIA